MPSPHVGRREGQFEKATPKERRAFSVLQDVKTITLGETLHLGHGVGPAGGSGGSARGCRRRSRSLCPWLQSRLTLVVRCARPSWHLTTLPPRSSPRDSALTSPSSSTSCAFMAMGVTMFAHRRSVCRSQVICPITLAGSGWWASTAALLSSLSFRL